MRTVSHYQYLEKRLQAQNFLSYYELAVQTNPGTGKTEVARIISRLFYEAGVLSEAKLIETDSSGLLGRFVGETAPKTKARVQEAMGGVLYIDEAYALAGGVNTESYGEEAIATLIKEMEDNRGKFCAIFAGYQNEMEKLLSLNPGFKSRIQFSLNFPDYSRNELGEIADIFSKKKGYYFTDQAKILFLDVVESFRFQSDFANARTVRNILDQVIMNQNLRTEDTPDDNSITLEDIIDYIEENGVDLSGESVRTRIGFIDK